MKNVIRLMVVLFVIGSSGFMMAGACDGSNPVADAAQGACGPCGQIAYGDATISGDARLDGFFKALGTLSMRTGSIKADFGANIKALGKAFGVADADLQGEVSAAMVTSVKGAIDAELALNIDGGLSVQYQAPKCSADINVAVEASADCQAKAGCDVQCDPGNVSVKCEGSCSGGCTGGCSGTLKCDATLSADGTCGGSCEGSCEVSGPAVTCEGTCTGGCSANVDGECSGTCKGDCSAGCSAQNADGSCNGTCSGTCSGTCEVQVEAKCDGECNGKCDYTPPSGQCDGSCKGSCKMEVAAEADCEGEVKCEGSCTGSCSGGCEGNVTPPSCQGSCDASADCQASAKAEASAEVKCTPPSLEIGYKLSATLEADAVAKATFLAKLELLKAKMTLIAQGLAEVRGLVEGYGEAGAKTEAPVVTLANSLQGLGEAALTGDYEVSAGLITCTLAAIGEVPGVITKVKADAGVVLTGSVEMMAVIGQ